MLGISGILGVLGYVSFDVSVGIVFSESYYGIVVLLLYGIDCSSDSSAV